MVEHKLCHLCVIKASQHSSMLSFSFGLRKYCILLKGVIEPVPSKMTVKPEAWHPVCGYFKGTVMPGGIPDGSVVKNLPANAGDAGSIPVP